MAKIRILNYSFDASEKKVTFTDYNPVNLDGILIITNVTDNIIIYNFADPAKGGTVATNVLTLTYDTSSMADADKLLIYYDEPTQTTSSKVIEDNSASIKTAVEVIDNMISGSEAQVDVVTSALPSGAATSALQLPDGHNVTVDNAGSVAAVNIQDGGNTITVDGTVTANLSATDNAVLDTIDAVLDTINAKLVTGTVIGDVNLGATDNAVLDTIDSVLDTINAKLVTGTDIGDVTINNAAAGSAVNIQDGGNTITVDGTVAITNADITSCKTALELLDNSVDGNYLNVNNNIAGTDVATGAGAVNAQTQRVTYASDDPVTTSVQIMDDWDNGVSDGCSVSGDTAHDTADAGEPVKIGAKANAAEPATVAENDRVNLSADLKGNLKSVGNIIHDTADTGAPLKIGAKAITALSGATMVAAADRTDLYADEDGVQIVKNWCTNNDILVERVSNTDGASTALTVFGATASSYNCITTIVVHNAHASTNGYVDIRDGTAGTILMTIPLPANGGAVVSLPVPLRQTTANTALAFDISAAISTCYLSFVGYKSRA